MRLHKMIFYTQSFILLSTSWGHAQPWTQTYTIPLNSTCNTQPAGNECIIAKTDVNPFTQLIFSWNAHRPAEGYYSFWVQGKDSASGQWSTWHKMIAWGNKVQQSYLSKADTIAQHIHVRFEAHTPKKFSGFRLKIKAHKGANLTAIQSITAACTDLNKFKSENATYFGHLPNVHIENVPCRSQFLLPHPENSRLCSPTSCLMLVEFLHKTTCDPLSFVHNVYDTGLDAYGSWPFNTAHAFEHSKGTYWYHVVRYNSFGDLHAQLMRGFPVIVSVRGALQGAAKPYESGHLLVVVGFDASNKMVLCHDPAFEDTIKTVKAYPLHSFLNAWETSRRLAYHVTPPLRQKQ